MTPVCRFCQAKELTTFADLGLSPLSNNYRNKQQLNEKETFFPLHARVCNACFLVQVEEFESPDVIFNDYAYLSSYSATWLAHAQRYVNHVIERFSLTQDNNILEVASNDGYLLQYFVEKNFQVLGIEPADNVAQVARDRNIPTLSNFFGSDTAKEVLKTRDAFDLIIGNNVFAHVPDINDFTKGLKLALKSSGVITLEFPHLLELIQHNQFDTIYHEHFSYLSLSTAQRILTKHGLRIFDVEKLPTHGGSIRIYATHEDNSSHKKSDQVEQLLQEEILSGIESLNSYTKFTDKILAIKIGVMDFFAQAKKQQKSIAAYGAAAKGNTLLNYCGIGHDFIDYVADLNPNKQGRFLPGTHIPIVHPDEIRKTRPDYLLILPWNIQEEIRSAHDYIQEWGGKFVTAIPELKVSP